MWQVHEGLSLEEGVALGTVSPFHSVREGVETVELLLIPSLLLMGSKNLSIFA